MTKKINTLEEYQEHFPPKQREEALKIALDIRKFELELYWKRAAYFWTFIAAAFTAYFVIYQFGYKPTDVLLLVASLGLVLSIGWYLANRGSKFWSTNWELHVDFLEDEKIGPLYKTVLSKESFSFLKPLTAYPFSVAKINQILNLYIVALWVYLVVHSVSLIFSFEEPCLYFNEIIILIISTIAVLSMLFGAQTDFQGRGEKYFVPREISKKEKNVPNNG